MAGTLGKSTLERAVTLVGYTAPRDYAAGEFQTREGSTRQFDAGSSMRVWVFDPTAAPEDGGLPVDMLKVKTANVPQVWQSLRGLGRGVSIELQYVERGAEYECVGIRVPATAGKG